MYLFLIEISIKTYSNYEKKFNNWPINTYQFTLIFSAFSHPGGVGF